MTASRGGTAMERPVTSISVSRHAPTSLGSHDVTARYIDGHDLTPALAREVVGLLRRAANETGWPARPDAIPYLQWFVRDYPGGAELCVMERHGQLIGMNTESRAPFLLDGRRVIARSGGNLAITPEWQGKGLNSLFFRYRGEHHHPDIDLLFTEPSHPAVLQRVLSGKGPDVPFGATVDLLLRPLDVAGLTRALGPANSEASSTDSATAAVLRARGVRRFVPRPAWLRRTIWHARVLRSRARHPRHQRPAATWTIEAVDHFDEGFAAFFEHAYTDFGLIRERTAEYLSWRYLDARAGRFVAVAAREDERILGFAVIGWPDDPTAVLADLLALPGRLDVVRSLLDYVLDAAQHENAVALSTYLTRGHPYRTAFMERGFVQRPAGGLFAYVPPEEADPFRRLADPTLRSHWVLGDTNHI